MPGRNTADNLAAKLIDPKETNVAACVHDDARSIVADDTPGLVNWKLHILMDYTCLCIIVAARRLIRLN